MSDFSPQPQTGAQDPEDSHLVKELRPINNDKLPLELIILIMEMLELGCNHSYDRSERQTEARNRLNTSQVCQQWRQGVHSFESIHGTIINIDCENRYRVENYIQRSASSSGPLIVRSHYLPGDSRDRFNSPKWRAILEETHRILDLEITFDVGDNFGRVVDALLFKPFPILAACTITGLRTWERPTVSLPALFPAHAAPKLKRVIISSISFTTRVNWESFNLVHLAIHQTNTDGNFEIYTPEWLDIFRHQPSLQFLLIHTAYDITLGSTNQLNPNLQVSLLNLRAFWYTSDIASCNALLGYLDIPATCNVHIVLNDTCRSFDKSMGGIKHGFSRLFGSMANDLTSSFHLDITIVAEWIQIRLVQNWKSSTEIDVNPDFTLRYNIPPISATDRYRPLVSELLEIFECTGSSLKSRISKLSLHISHGLKNPREGYDIKDSLTSYISSLGNVTDLCLRGAELRNIFDIVRPNHLAWFPKLTDADIKIFDDSSQENPVSSLIVDRVL